MKNIFAKTYFREITLTDKIADKVEAHFMKIW